MDYNSKVKMELLAVIWMLLTVNISVIIGYERNVTRNRIIGGESTTIKKHPHQVSLRQYNEHFCGGSIITQYHVLTAAHCVNWWSPGDKSLKVYAGSGLSTRGVPYEIENVKTHPNFDESKRLHDIAVVKLYVPIQSSKLAHPIKVASRGPKEGDTAIVTGWGDTDPDNEKTPLHLQMARTKILSIQKCREFKQDLKFLLCAFVNTGVGVCFGDSGGPLVVRGELVGVTSFLISKCAGGFPDFYVNVHRYLEFIKETIAPETLPG